MAKFIQSSRVNDGICGKSSMAIKFSVQFIDKEPKACRHSRPQNPSFPYLSLPKDGLKVLELLGYP